LVNESSAGEVPWSINADLGDFSHDVGSQSLSDAIDALASRLPANLMTRFFAANAS